MANSIDNRVAQLTLENRQFEAAATQSLKTVNRLDDAFKMADGTKGMDDLAAATERVNVQGLLNNANKVRVQFVAMEEAARQLIRSVSQDIYQQGKTIVKSLTIDPITAGWNKYGEKLSSVQTLLNSTGLDLDTLNGYLDRLMWFSDETSYGFTDMTSALAQMTSSGGDIKKLIPMIQGVANSVAFAGKGAAEFSRVMYNLNQSYGMGYLTLMDWKSVELSGAASKELKQTLIDVAKELGTIDAAGNSVAGHFVDISTFSSTLADKWATSDVLEEAFGRFNEMTEKAYQMVQAGEVDTAAEAYAILSKEYNTVSLRAAKAAQEAKTFTEAIQATKDAVSTGWMRTFEYIFGDKTQATQLWTGIADEMYQIFASGAEVRNDILKTWWQGYDDIDRTLIGTEYETPGIVRGLYDYDDAIARVRAGLPAIESGRTMLLTAFKNIYTAVKTTFGAITEAFRSVFPKITGKQLLDITRHFRDFTKTLVPSEIAIDNLRRGFAGLFAGIKNAGILAKKFIGVLKPLGSIAARIADEILSAFGRVGDMLTNGKIDLSGAIAGLAAFASFVASVLNNIIDISTKGAGAVEAFADKFSVFDFIAASVQKLLSGAGKIISAVFSGLSSGMESLTGHSLYKLFTSGAIAALLVNLVKTAKTATKKIGSITTIGTEIATTISQLTTVLKELTESIKARSIMRIAIAIGILAVAMFVISHIPTQQIIPALGGLIGIIASTLGGLVALSKVLSMGSLTGIQRVSSALILFAVAIAILTASAKKLSGLSFTELLTGLIGTIVIMAALAGAAAILSRFVADLKAKTKGLIAFAAAVYIIVLAVQKLSAIPLADLAKGVVAVAVLIGVLGAFLKLTSGASLRLGTGIGLVLIAASMLIFASAISELGKIPLAGAVQGIIMIGVILGMISGFAALSKGNGSTMGRGIGLVLIATSMLIFASAISELGKIPLLGAVQGVIMIGAILGMIAGFAALTSSSSAGKMIALGVSMVLVAASAMIFASAINSLSSIGWDGLLTGVVSLGVMIGIVVVALNALNANILGAASLLIAAVAIDAIALALFGLSSIPFGSLMGACLGLVIALAAVSGAVLLLGATAPVSLAGAAVLAVVGIAMLICAAAVWVLFAALSSLSAVELAQLTVVFSALAPVLVNLAGGMVLAGLAAIVAGVGMVILGAGALVAGAGLVVLGIGGVTCAAAIWLLAKAVDTFLGVLGLSDGVFSSASASMEAYFDDVTASIEDAKNAQVDATSGSIETIAKTGNAATDQANDAATAARNAADATKQTTTEVQNLDAANQDAADSAKDLFGAYTPKLSGDIDTSNLIASIQGGFDGAAIDTSGMLSKLNGSLVSGESLSTLESAGGTQGESVATGFNSVDFSESGEQATNGLAAGLLAGKSKVRNAAVALGITTKNAFNNIMQIMSPSRVMRWSGEMTAEGIVVGMLNRLVAIRSAASQMSMAAVEGFNQNATDVMASGEAAMTFTPVVDMTNLSPANVQQLVGNAQLAVASQLAEDRQAAKMTTDLNSMRAQITELVALNAELIEIVRQGGDVYLDGDVVAGSVNARLGGLV